MQISNFDFQCDLSPVILWQYLDAEKLKSLISYQQDFMNVAVRDFIEELSEKILNISTANESGLELWGRLLNVERPVYEKDGQVVPFDDEQYRLVLRAQIYLLAFNGSAEALNHFFKILFPDLPVIIEDNLNMSVSINILKDKENIPEWQQVLLDYLLVPSSATGGGKKYAVSLPRPSGVQFVLSYNKDFSGTFGFEGQTYTTEQGTEQSMEGFDNGTFYQ